MEMTNNQSKWNKRLLLILIIFLLIAWAFFSLADSAQNSVLPAQSIEYSEPQPVPAPRVIVSEPQATPQPQFSPKYDGEVKVPPVPAPKPDSSLFHHS
ncbi:MAG: hypothetical protein R3293_15650 [Candidatus Promineifilaceae bacterium]|nr:hypothetical protein [Candidatus Promineifilaceae bacterium]